MRIAVLALQGAFLEHEQLLHRLGVKTTQIRKRSDFVNQTFDGLILPGGESTTMGKLLRDLDLFDPIREAIEQGLPTFGTCAGLILLAKEIGQQDPHLAVMSIRVTRNAYGRQLGSFFTEEDFLGIGHVPMTFIRGPIIESVEDEVTILSRVKGQIVAARQGHLLVTSFHPELGEDTRIHEYFLDMCRHKN